MAAPTELTAIVDMPDGSAAFRPVSVPRELTAIAAGVPAVLSSAPIQALALSLLEAADESVGESEPHPASRAQLLVVLEGVLEIDSGPEARRFGAGEHVLVADVAGRGHVTRVIERPARCLLIALDRDAVARLLARR